MYRQKKSRLAGVGRIIRVSQFVAHKEKAQQLDRQALDFLKLVGLACKPGSVPLARWQPFL